MHELAVTQNIVAIAESEAKKQGFAKVLGIKLQIGELSGVIPQCVADFFPFASAGTVAEGAKVTAETIPAAIMCPDCGYEGPPGGAACPGCGGYAFRLTAGREFFVDSMEVE